MRVETHNGVSILVVSRRNLMTLLSKLDGHPPDSSCMIGAPSMYQPTYIKAEEDDVHYSHPDRQGVGPGVMIPETEVDLFARNWEQDQTA